MGFLFTLMILPVVLCSQGAVLPDVFAEANVVHFYNNGQEIEVSEEDCEKFDQLFVEAISGSRQMPAYAVSLHKLTMEDFKEGYWVKFDYGKTMKASKMPFDQLLIHIQEDMYGVNIIRGNKGRFEGRCFYLELDNKTFDEVYDFLVNVEALPSGDLKVEVEKGEENKVDIVTEENDEDDDKDSEDEVDGREVEDENSGEAEDEKIDEADEAMAGGEIIETEEVEASAEMPSINNDKKEENKVIKQEATEKVSASEKLVEMVSQWDEEL